MNALIAVIFGAIAVYLTYTRYARRIDRNVIQSDPKRATPATLYMDGVDFMPTNRNILFDQEVRGCPMLREAAQKLMI
jgi:carbon starvation protein